jgi:GNAT superfamily N-acetyltransferase
VGRIEIVPFSNEHLEAAASLLAKRHRRHRLVEPLLPARFEEGGAAGQELEAAWRRPDASGAAALRAGTLVGYLIGAPRDPSWGANVWVELAGHAVDEAEVVRDLYATAASRWVDEGRTRHYAFVPASDEPLVTAWFRLGFGQQQAHGLREIPNEVDVIPTEGIQIRGPDPAEIETLIDIELALPEHQRASPVFSGVSLATREESRAEWLSTLAGDEEQIFIGVYRGRPVACWALVPPERSPDHHGLLRPEGASYLGFASTLPEARGSGVGIALTNASLAWARQQGYASMVTDWRVTNLLSSRFWPHRGFRETFWRLYRSIP